MSETFVEAAERLDDQLEAILQEMMLAVGSGVLYDGPSPLILDPDYDMTQMPALAEKCGVSLDLLSRYRVMADYINMYAQGTLDPEFSLAPEDFAGDELGLVFNVFEPYFNRKVNRIRQDLVRDADEEACVLHSTGQLPVDPWEAEADELAALQKDALRQCD